jgi:hypothetical protein
MAIKRFVLLTLCVPLLLWGCSGGEPSLTEYVERMNDVAGQASQRAGELFFTDAAEVTDFTPQMVAASLETGLREIRIPLQEAVDAIEPPDQLADLHHRMWDWHAEFIAIEEALAARVATTEDTEAGWEGLSDSPEMGAYRASIAEGKQLCTDLQADLDATSERGDFADTPWLPGEMKEVVSAALGCEWFPERPEDVYRYPPPTSTP